MKQLERLKEILAILYTAYNVYDFNDPSKRLHPNIDKHQAAETLYLAPWLILIRETEREIEELEGQHEAVNQVNLILQQSAIG